MLPRLAQRISPSIARWFRVLFLTAIGTITFELLLPVAWARAKSVDLGYSPAFMGVTVWVLTLIMSYVVLDPIRLRVRQWRSLLWYPPVWLTIPLSWYFAALSERLPIAVRPQSSGPDWQHIYPVFPISAALFVAALLRYGQARGRREGVRLDDPTSEEITWQVLQPWIEAGERPTRSNERDLFGHTRIAMKIGRVLEKTGQSIALLGPMGSGKSTILATVRGQLIGNTHTAVIAQFDVWAVPKPEDVPRLALSRMIGALDEIVDTVAPRGLSTSYQRLAAAEPSGRLSKALGIESASDSLDELERLVPILDALNVHVVLMVEDAERAGDTFDTRHCI